MTTKTLKKIGIFCGLLIVSANCIPILATIASIVLGIVSVFLIVAMPIACFFTNGRKRLSTPFQHLPTLKLFHFPFLLFVVALVLFTPALFALSLILHLYLASTIVCKIVASLLAIVVAMFFVFWFGPFGPDEKSEKKNDIYTSTESEVIKQRGINKSIGQIEQK